MADVDRLATAWHDSDRLEDAPTVVAARGLLFHNRHPRNTGFFGRLKRSYMIFVQRQAQQQQALVHVRAAFKEAAPGLMAEHTSSLGMALDRLPLAGRCNGFADALPSRTTFLYTNAAHRLTLRF